MKVTKNWAFVHRPPGSCGFFTGGSAGVVPGSVDG
jgi:hypothetical protein